MLIKRIQQMSRQCCKHIQWPIPRIKGDMMKRIKRCSRIKFNLCGGGCLFKKETIQNLASRGKINKILSILYMDSKSFYFSFFLFIFIIQR